LTQQNGLWVSRSILGIAKLLRVDTVFWGLLVRGQAVAAALETDLHLLTGLAQKVVNALILFWFARWVKLPFGANSSKPWGRPGYR